MECQPSFILIAVKSWQLHFWFHIFAIYFYLEIKSLEDKLDISLLSGIRELGIGVQERFTCDIILQPLGGHSILDPC